MPTGVFTTRSLRQGPAAASSLGPIKAAAVGGPGLAAERKAARRLGRRAASSITSRFRSTRPATTAGHCRRSPSTSALGLRSAGVAPGGQKSPPHRVGPEPSPPRRGAPGVRAPVARPSVLSSPRPPARRLFVRQGVTSDHGTQPQEPRRAVPSFRCGHRKPRFSASSGPSSARGCVGMAAKVSEPPDRREKPHQGLSGLNRKRHEILALCATLPRSMGGQVPRQRFGNPTPPPQMASADEACNGRKLIRFQAGKHPWAKLARHYLGTRTAACGECEGGQAHGDGQRRSFRTTPSDGRVHQGTRQACGFRFAKRQR